MQFDDFVKHGLYLRGWSGRTAHTYRQAWNSYSEFLVRSGKQDTLEKLSLEAWVCDMRTRGLTPGGCNMYIRTMNSYISWLNDETGSNLPRLKLLKNNPKPLQAITAKDIKLILSFKPKGIQLRTWTLICLLLDTGIRIDEALTLKSDNIDLDNLIIRVLGKGTKERLVPISQECRKILFRYISKHPGQFAFHTQSGLPVTYRNAYRDIKTVCKQAGVEGAHIHPHAFRHAFSVNYIAKGGDIYRLSRILGHTSINTTQIYLRSMGIEHIQTGHHSLVARV
jgi:integrase/recombinase XerD